MQFLNVGIQFMQFALRYFVLFMNFVNLLGIARVFFDVWPRNERNGFV